MNWAHRIAVLSSAAAAGVLPPGDLSAPDLLANVSQQGTNSIATGSISANAGDLLVVIVQTRENVQATHGVPTTTLANLFDFGGGARFTGLTPHHDDDATLFIDTTVFWGYATDDTGTGTITCALTGSGTIAFASLTVLRFAAGWDATPIGTTGTSADATATSAAVSFAAAPAASSCGLLTMAENSFDADGTVPSGYTELVDINVSSSFHCMVAFKLDSPGQGPHSFTALGSPSARSLYAVEIEEGAGGGGGGGGGGSPPSEMPEPTALPTATRTVNVASSAAFETALASAVAGDRIVLADGTYSDSGGFATSVNGTSSEPIVIIAANPLGASITSRLEVSHDYVYLRDLDFNGANMPLNQGGADPTVGTSGQLDLRGDWIRVTGCRFRNWRGATSSGSTAHLDIINSLDPLVEYCEFTAGQATGIRVRVYAGGARRPHIVGCHFHDHTGPGGTNGQEAIQVGVGTPDSLIEAEALIEWNLFENWNAEEECISLKSSDNVVQFNTFKLPGGGTVRMTAFARHGQDNHFISNHFTNARGIAVTGLRPKVVGNVFVSCTEPIRLFCGDDDPTTEPSGDYPWTVGAIVAGNNGNVHVGWNYSGSFSGKTKAGVSAGGSSGNRIEAHGTGTIYYEGNVGGNAGHSQGTVIDGSTAETIEDAVVLTSADVGPGAI